MIHLYNQFVYNSYSTTPTEVYAYSAHALHKEILRQNCNGVMIIYNSLRS